VRCRDTASAGFSRGHFWKYRREEGEESQSRGWLRGEIREGSAVKTRTDGGRKAGKIKDI
jgi:hypothetical protein